MKKILVPTDFSDNANNALRYAVNIANYFQAEVHLLHVYQVRSTTGAFKPVREYIKENAERDLSETIRQFKNSIIDRTVLQGRAIEGNILGVINSIAKHEKMDLIVMGTQGASGLKEIFLGSKTSEVMKHSAIPLLAIPNNFKYRSIKEIILPVDSGMVADSDVLAPLLELAKVYKSNIKVMHLETGKIMAGFDPDIDISLGKIPHSFHKFSGSNEVKKVIDIFVEEENADLLCMIRRTRGFWQNLFYRSVTSKEIFDSRVPLLILHTPIL